MVQIIKSNGGGGSGGGSGEGDMKKSVYDPQNVGKNVYDYTYFINKPTIPSKTSDLTNDSGFVDSSDLSTALAGKQDTLTAGTGIDITSNVISATGGGGSGDVVGPASSTNGHLAVFDGTTGKQIKDGGAMPTIPTKVSQLENDSGFTTNTGTITSVKMNGATVASSGEANLGTVITSHQNIKTVNSNSLVGTGNVSINETKVSTTAPTSPTKGMVWYDTTNDVLKTYDGSSWNEVGGGGGGEGNTKTFTLSGTTGATALSEAQAIYDWYNAGKNPIVMYDSKMYVFSRKQPNIILFTNTDIGSNNYSHLGYSHTKQTAIAFRLSTDTVTSISDSSYANAGVYVLATNQNYSTPYTPQYDGSPATKKYVDDNVNTKTFYLSNTSDLTNAQAAYDWFKAGNGVILVYLPEVNSSGRNSGIYLPYSSSRTSSNVCNFVSIYNERNQAAVGNNKGGGIYKFQLYFSLSGSTVTSITRYGKSAIASFLATDKENRAYTPTDNYHPATKKYVDDNVAYVGSSAPSNPTEGRLWYDSTNKTLKFYDGSNWKTVTVS